MLICFPRGEKQNNNREVLKIRSEDDRLLDEIKILFSIKDFYCFLLYRLVDRIYWYEKWNGFSSAWFSWCKTNWALSQLMMYHGPEMAHANVNEHFSPLWVSIVLCWKILNSYESVARRLTEWQKSDSEQRNTPTRFWTQENWYPVSIPEFVIVDQLPR